MAETNWKQFAFETGGTFIEGHYGKGNGVEITFKNWKIIFDTLIDCRAVGNSTTWIYYTRIRVSFLTKDHFKFTIHHKNLLDKIGKYIGVKQVEIGDSEFDKDFIVHGNDESKVHALFSSKKLREMILVQENIELQVFEGASYFNEPLPEGVFQLYYCVTEVLTDLVKLKSLNLLFQEILDQLFKIGSVGSSPNSIEASITT
jgi:hypothetical protein